MTQQKVAKVTISLPHDLLQFADELARQRTITRSQVITELLKKEEEAHLHALMAEGYQQMGQENRQEAEEALCLTSEVVLRDG